MANRTDPLVMKSIHGTNPENLVPKIVRTKIYEMRFWKEHCFGLKAETLVDKAKELDHIGGTFGGNRKPTPFMCLVLKMLQIQPEKAIVLEFIKNELFKYARVLGAFYMRLTGTDIDVYQYLEPLYNDCRKLRRKLADGSFALTHVDEVIEELLTSDYWCDIALPRIKKRETMEWLGLLEHRKSALKDEDFEEEEVLNENDQIRSRNRSRSRSRERDESRRRGPDRHLNDDRDQERNGSWGERERNRDRNHYHHRRVRDEMDYDHHSRRWRSHSRSPNRSRNHQNHRDDEDDGTDHPDPEIAEANSLRASLGLKPLKL